MIFSLLFSISLFLCFLAMKFFMYMDECSCRPSLKVLLRYNYGKNTNHKRNARAFLYGACFFFAISCLTFYIEGMSAFAISHNDKNRLLKYTLLLSCVINLFTRLVVYKETIKNQRSFVIPIMEILDVFKKTPWIMKGSDVLSVVITTTTTLSVLIALLLFTTH